MGLKRGKQRVLNRDRECDPSIPERRKKQSNINDHQFSILFSRQLLRHWGFRRSEDITWVKTNKYVDKRLKRVTILPNSRLQRNRFQPKLHARYGVAANY